MGKHTHPYMKHGYSVSRNDVCLTDCVFLCILSAAFGILWLDLDLGVRVNHISKLYLYFYIHVVSFSLYTYIYIYTYLYIYLIVSLSLSLYLSLCLSLTEKTLTAIVASEVTRRNEKTRASDTDVSHRHLSPTSSSSRQLSSLTIDLDRSSNINTSQVTFTHNFRHICAARMFHDYSPEQTESITMFCAPPSKRNVRRPPSRARVDVDVSFLFPFPHARNVADAKTHHTAKPLFLSLSLPSRSDP